MSNEFIDPKVKNDGRTYVQLSNDNIPNKDQVSAMITAGTSAAKAYQGGYDAATNTPDLDVTPIVGIKSGDVWDVTVGGTFFTTLVEPGDTLTARQDDPTLEAHWVVVQANLTPASIKSQYESNADTNAFTDTEKADLATLSGGAVTALHRHGTEDVEYSTAHDHVNTLQDLVNHMWSDGACATGFGLTDNTDGTVSIASGSAVLRSTNTPHGELNGYAIPASLPADVVLTDEKTNYIVIDYNAGTPKTIAIDDLNILLGDRTKTLVYAVNRLGLSVHVVDLRASNVDYARKNAVKDYLTNGIEHSTGSSVVDAGSLQFDVTAGIYYILNNQFTLPAFDGSVDTFEYVYGNGVGGWTRVAAATSIDNTNYDGGAGALIPVGNNKFSVHFLYGVINIPGHYNAVYGTADYLTLSEARAAPAPAILPSDLDALSTAVLVAKIITQKGQVAFADIQSPFAERLQSAIATTHNSLAGVQGGAPGDYQHLTTAEVAKLTSLEDTPPGVPKLTFQNDPVEVNPGTNNFTINAVQASQSNASAIFLNDAALNSIDVGELVAAWKPGAVIRFMQVGDPTKYFQVRVSGLATDNTGWWRMLVTWEIGTGLEAGQAYWIMMVGNKNYSRPYQELHTVTAGEVTAGFFTLTYTPEEALSVRVTALDGVDQLNKQTIGIGAEIPDFDVLSGNQVHINNNGAATGLSGSIIANDKVVISYRG